MSHKIEELYADSKYKLAVYYLKEIGIHCIEDLKMFHFDNLIFLPGVEEKTISEMQVIFHNNCTSTNKSHEIIKRSNCETDKSAYLSKFYSNKPLHPTVLEGTEGPETAVNISVHDVSISDMYSEVPRSAPFVSNCSSQGKVLMSQLSNDDFENALALKGLGAASVRNLYKIYQQYLRGEYCVKQNSMFDTDQKLTDLPLEHVFGNLKHNSIFIQYCHNNGIKYIADLKDFDFDIAQIKGIGALSIERIKQKYSDLLRSTPVSLQESIILNHVSLLNMEISLEFLCPSVISESSLKILKGHGFLTVKDLYENSLTSYEYLLINKAVSFLNVPVTTNFKNQLERHNEIACISLIKKSQGYTLQQIADEFGITRERIRQIIAKTSLTLMGCANMIADILLQRNNNCFSSSEITCLFEDSVVADCCKFVLLSSDKLQYLNISDKFVRKALSPDNIDDLLKQFSNEIIGEGVNFYDRLENIEYELPKYNLQFLDFEDIQNYLVKSGYHFFGDYVAKGNQSYAFICYDAILKYFPFDIKLNSDPDNEEIKLLREIVDKHYHGLILPDNNRALTGRLANYLILSGRGRYCPIEKALYGASLFDEIYRFIQESSQSSFYYTELFSEFQGRFLAETNITNANFLHGMLKYLYFDDFNFERDLLVKNGATRQDYDDRLCELLITNKGPMTKHQLKKAIPGLNDFVISFAAARISELIQWEYNEYNHMNNINYDADDYANINLLLADQLKEHDGYSSENLLFNAIKLKYPLFIKKNKIENASNLYYIIGFLFEEKYKFRRPHILSCDFPIKDLSVANIARELLGCHSTLHHSAYFELAESLCWAKGTIYSVFTELSRGFVRISADDYIQHDSLNFTDTFLQKVQREISNLVNPSGYYALNNIFNFNSFPDCPYKWNGFLLESIIEKYKLGFKIITPQVQDRRLQRGIITKSDASQTSFEDLVLYHIKKDGISTQTEDEFQNYLKNKGLIINLLPQELYEFSNFRFKNGQFTVKL